MAVVVSRGGGTIKRGPVNGVLPQGRNFLLEVTTGPIVSKKPKFNAAGIHAREEEIFSSGEQLQKGNDYLV